MQVNFGNIAYTDVLDERIREEVLEGVGRFAERLTRIEVHLEDTNGPKGGDDKRVLLEARLAGDKPFVVEARGDDLYDLVVEASGKLGRALERRLGRRDDRAA